jgi:hypothetical protein
MRKKGRNDALRHLGVTRISMNLRLVKVHSFGGSQVPKSPYCRNSSACLAGFNAQKLGALLARNLYPLGSEPRAGCDHESSEK